MLCMKVNLKAVVHEGLIEELEGLRVLVTNRVCERVHQRRLILINCDNNLKIRCKENAKISCPLVQRKR